MSNAYKKYQMGDIVLEIMEDDCPDNPRDWDNFGKMVCFHKRYRLPNELEMDEDFGEWEELDRRLQEKGAKVIFPIYMYDHSGLTISTRPFSCPWDSMQIGYIVATKEDIITNFNVKRISQKSLEKAKEVLLSEVKTLDDYLTGNVYVYRKYYLDACGREGETIDACGGFYGDNFEENGLFESAGVEDINEWEEIE